MRMRTVVTSLILLLLLTSVALSQTSARESFNYTPTTLTGLGTAANGFGGPWVADPGDNGIEGLAALGNTRFSYGDLSWTLPYDTLHLQVVKSGAWSDHNRYKRPLAAAWTNTAGKKYWVSYLLDVKEPLPVGNTYFMVKLYEGTNERLAIGKGGGRDANSPLFTCGSGWPGNAGDDVSAVPITAGPVWIVVRIDMDGTTNPKRTFMWIDPNPATEPDTTTAAVKRNSTFDTGFDTIALEFGGDGANVRLIFDEIRLAQSYGDLTATTPAGTVARESFSYTPTTVAGLGTAVNGFGGPWVSDPSANGMEGLVTVGNTRFSYGDLSWTLPYDTLHLQVLKSDAWSTANRYKRPLAALWPNTAGKKYYVSYLVDIKEPLPVGNTYFMVKLYEGTNERLAIGKGGGRDANAPVWTCGSGWPGNAGDDVSAKEIAAGPVWIVVRIDMDGTTNPKRTFMWVDPNPAIEPDTTTADVKRNSTFDTGFDTIALEFGGDGTNQRLIFDEIRLATSYAGLSTITSVPSEDGVPAQFNLSQNYPNPFNPSTKISYTVERTEQVRLSVHDVLGREVAVLVDGVQSAGEHVVTFRGSGLTSGLYFYRLQSAKGVITKKMLLMK